mmetsp:Transcript_29629/g.67092  ORF Transcript_29629/g.67092 Transcript_29629/m.67092 type:complete len:87 (-) Transcript_29629:111-371(-)
MVKGKVCGMLRWGSFLCADMCVQREESREASANPNAQGRDADGACPQATCDMANGVRACGLARCGGVGCRSHIAPVVARGSQPPLR